MGLREYILRFIKKEPLAKRDRSNWIETSVTIYTIDDNGDTQEANTHIWKCLIRIEDICYIQATEDDITTCVYLRDGSALNVNKSYEALKKLVA